MPEPGAPNDGIVWNTVLYVGGGYEKRTRTSTLTDHVFYVAAPGRVIGQLIRHQSGTTGSDEWRYFHVERQGTPARITDASGQLVASQEHDVWGARRADDWRLPRSEVEVPFDVRRGYTGHEHDDEFGNFEDGSGVINMGGRTYDSFLKRFTSADPVVAAPAYGPSWNPYSYALNNPTRYTDPSGHVPAPNTPDKCDPMNPVCNMIVIINEENNGGCYNAECHNSPNGPLPGGQDPGTPGPSDGGGRRTPPPPPPPPSHTPMPGSQTPNAASPAGATGRSMGIGTSGGPLSGCGPDCNFASRRFVFERQSIAEQVAGGVWDFFSGTVTGLFHAVFHPIDTLTAWKDRIVQGWEEDGLLGAFNYGFNPAYQFLLQADAAIEAWNRGDLRGAVSNGLGAGVTAAGTIAGVAGGVRAAGSRAASGGGIPARSTAREATGLLGHKGFELKNLQAVRNSPEVIGGRSFSGHALDQMQNRGIMPSVVENAIQTGTEFPGKTPNSVGYFDPANKVRVILNSETRGVITVIRGVL